MTRLDAAKIKRSLTASTARHIHCIEVFSKINSTNTYLKGQLPPPSGQFRIAIAEHQTAGRGRHGRQWISTPGGSLCLSLAYRFPQSSPGFSELYALTLALGIAVADALSGIGVAEVKLKWPNDLLVGDAKLGGILTETITSPTLASQLDAFLERYPGAKLSQYEPTGRDSAHRGAQLAFGEGNTVDTVYDFEKADRIVAFDSDFLLN
ncbi:MAG: biotin--[acetyl-CoA-carboxylase] ligase, partial [Proteobacteria bacterium]|nr:biotin--[acetyl-CoA-carboxylase] ligase [Pseudomonadota bacterium]